MKYYIRDFLDKYGCYTVGYDEKDGSFEPHSDFERYDDAQRKCNELNGIYIEPAKPKEAEITLRDYFAGKAMQSLISAYESDEIGLVEKITQKAYEYADAMLEERSRSNE